MIPRVHTSADFFFLVGWFGLGFFDLACSHGKFAFENTELVDLMRGVLIYMFNAYYQFVSVDQFYYGLKVFIST